MDLRALANTLIADNLDAAFRPATPDMPSDRIDVMLPVGGFDEPFTIQLTEIDTDPEAMPGVEMYQIWAPIPVVFDAESIPSVVAMLPAINVLTPLPAFNVDGGERFAYLRSIGLVDAECDPGRVITEAVWLVGFALEQHAATIVALGTAGEGETA